MKWIGHTEFGPNYIPIHNKNLNFKNDLEINHWIEQWYLTYKNIFELLKNKQNVYFISYSKLCSIKDYWFQIQKLVKIEEPYDFEFKESKKVIALNIDKGLVFDQPRETIFCDYDFESVSESINLKDFI